MNRAQDAGDQLLTRAITLLLDAPVPAEGFQEAVTSTIKAVTEADARWSASAGRRAWLPALHGRKRLGVFAAAAAVILLTIGSWMLFVRDAPTHTEETYPKTQATGDVRIIRDEIPVEATSPPVRGDRIVAGVDGARLELGGYCHLDLDPNTELILAGKLGDEAVELTTGRLTSRIDENKGGFSVVTPLGPVRVIGTKFVTSVKAKTLIMVSVVVDSGIVSYELKDATGRITAGESRTFIEPSPGVDLGLTEVELREALKLVRRLTDREFTVRQRAVADLIAMGPRVLRLARSIFAETEDSEIKLRCGMVIKGIMERRRSAAKALPPGDARASVVTVEVLNGSGDVILKANGFFLDDEEHVVTASRPLRGAHAARVRTAGGVVRNVRAVVGEEKTLGFVVLAVELRGPYVRPLRISTALPYGPSTYTAVTLDATSDTRLKERSPIWWTQLYPLLNPELAMRIPTGFDGAPLVDPTGQVIAVAITAPATEGDTVSMRPALYLRYFKARDEVLFSTWTAGFDEKWQTSTEGICDKGLGYIWAEEYDEASEHFRNMTRKYPKQADAWLYAGFCVHRAVGAAEALTYYDKAVTLDPNHPIYRHHRAWAYTDLKRANEAIKEEKEAIRIRPDYQEAQVGLGRLYFGLERYPEAAACFEPLTILRPDHAMSWNSLGWSYYQMGQRDRAARAFREEIRIIPDSARGHYSLAAAVEGLGDLDAADKSFSEAVRVDPKAKWPRYWLGHLRLRREQYKKALPVLLKASELNPRYHYPDLQVARAYEGLGKLEEATRAYARSIRFHPTHPSNYFGLGGVCARLSRHKEAAKAYSMALLLDPKNDDYHFPDPKRIGILFALGNEFITIGYLGHAVEAFEKAIKLQPGHPGAVKALDRARKQLELKQNLSKALSERVRAEPDDLTLRLGYAKSCVIVGDLDEAAKQHEELKQQDAESAEELGEILRWFDSLKVKPK